MLILSEAVAAFLHGYSVLVVIRCMSYLHDKVRRNIRSMQPE